VSAFKEEERKPYNASSRNVRSTREGVQNERRRREGVWPLTVVTALRGEIVVT